MGKLVSRHTSSHVPVAFFCVCLCWGVRRVACATCTQSTSRTACSQWVRCMSVGSGLLRGLQSGCRLGYGFIRLYGFTRSYTQNKTLSSLSGGEERGKGTGVSMIFSIESSTTP